MDLLLLVIGLGLQRVLPPASWTLCGFPFSIGWAFAMFATPLRLWYRLWYRLRPWRD